MTRHVVAPATDLPPGGRKLVTIANRPIALFNVDGQLYAIQNRCPHQAGALVDGYLTGRLTSTTPGDYTYEPDEPLIRCPWHAWEFNLRTGLSQCEPSRIKVRNFPITVETAEKLIAETFKVEIDNSYIVIDL